MSQVSVANGHGGGLDSDGGHNCYVGSCAGTYHYHRPTGSVYGGSYSYVSPAFCVTVPVAGGNRTLNRSEVALIQFELLMDGFNPGPVDGILGYRTSGAIRAYEKYYGLSVSPNLRIYWATVYHMGIECR